MDSDGQQNATAGHSNALPKPKLAGVVKQMLQRGSEMMDEKRGELSHETAFDAYNELLDDACSVLAIQHARIVDLERRVNKLEHPHGS